MVNKSTLEANMLRDIKTIIDRSSDTLLQDAMGVFCLCVVMFGALHAPAFF